MYTKELIDSVRVRFWLSSIFWVSYSQWKVKYRWFILIQYKPFFLNNSEVSWRVKFTSFCKSLYLVDVTIILVSLAYTMVSESLSMIFGRSLMYMLNSMGPLDNLE